MRHIEVAAGLIVHEGRYLIAKRKAGVHLGGLWEFPGGKREAGESLEECLHRELLEELNILVQDPVPFQTVRHEYPEKIVELHFFHCRMRGGEAMPLDCAEIRWVYPFELAGYDFPPADQPVIHALQQATRRQG
ncbi:MAG: 8-oxo-dGTP diphosphatase MutT [Nitrospiraceae bacterium]|nr:8-oxo-dGTP diphosphatase MutT [Nitrospiraceae bacterium]